MYKIHSKHDLFQDGVIRVDTPNPLYEDYPYTVQTGGCGERGEYVHITPDFALEVDGLVASTFGPPGKNSCYIYNCLELYVKDIVN